MFGGNYLIGMKVTFLRLLSKYMLKWAKIPILIGKEWDTNSSFGMYVSKGKASPLKMLFIDFNYKRFISWSKSSYVVIRLGNKFSAVFFLELNI